MKNQFEGIEPMVNKSKISVPYSWWAGDTATAFFKSLMEKGELLGRKCGGCGKVYVPPRKVCPCCFKEMEWKSVGNEGTLLTFTVVHKKLTSLPQDPPVAYGLIKLDGADTAILHQLSVTDTGKLSIGMRMKAKLSEQRKGTVRDIEYFEPVSR